MPPEWRRNQSAALRRKDLSILRKLNATFNGSYLTALLMLGVTIMPYGLYIMHTDGASLLRMFLDANHIQGFDWFLEDPFELVARVAPNTTIIRIALVLVLLLLTFLSLLLVLAVLAPLYLICLSTALLGRMTIGRFFDHETYVHGVNAVLLVLVVVLVLIHFALVGFDFVTSVVSARVVFVAVISLLLISITLALIGRRDDETPTDVVVEQFTDAVYSDVVEPKDVVSFSSGLTEEYPEERFYTGIGFTLAALFFTTLEIVLLFFNENVVTIGVDYALFFLVCICALGAVSNFARMWADGDKPRSKKGPLNQPDATE